MYEIRITKIGVVPMTSRFDLIKIFAIVAILGNLCKRGRIPACLHNC